MRTTVTFRLPDGSRRVLGPGDLIGRLWNAALQLDDARISEAHAMVSLRGRDLELLALRGRFAVEGRPTREAVLRPGLVLELAAGLELEVEALRLPDQVLGLQGDGLPLRVLPAVCSLRVRPQPRLTDRFDPEADLGFWSTGDAWKVRVGSGVPAQVAVGDAWTLHGRRFEVRLVGLGAAGASPTEVDGAIGAPLTLVTHWDQVQVLRAGQPALSLSGIPARILCELAAVGAPLSWQALAREVWRDDEDDWVLRKRLDVHLGRLRRKLREGRVRTDLVAADGCGNFALVLEPGDRVEDRS